MKVLALFTGTTRPIGPQNAPSGIDKRPVTSVRVNHLGIIGDVQVDKRYHGGPERALHQYALRGYETIIKRHPLMHKRAIPGSIGENLTSTLMHDENVNIGDIYAIGQVEVQVSSPRIPCWKIEEKLNQKGLVKFIAKQHITGWYYRILKEGVISTGDSITLLSRENPDISVASFVQQHFDKNTSLEALLMLSRAKGLDPEWKARFTRRIKQE
ncbi:MOSC domain-containing protein [Paraglaciecola sp. 20A4]|uniref:MOSC domain-containing protein n=1 Tax=Paraglaciecola sp. 20A4 TaxID=2687288 RepID=UPI00140C9172|nr:MOSC domain-containing protein [Paraglaciecola sp. 20A4]